MTRFGVGYCEVSDSFAAGVKAAESALQDGDIAPGEADLCFLFCTSRHDAPMFFDGVKSRIGEVHYFGGFANGTITNRQFGYDGYQSAVGVLQSDEIDMQLFRQDGIAFNEFNTGKALFDQIAAAKLDPDTPLILFFDAVNRQKGRFQMNYVTPLIEGALGSISQCSNVVGARLMGDMKFKPTYQWCEDAMIQNSAMALAFTGDIEMDVLRLEGCAPASAYHTVTDSDGATILEIDGRPATDFIAEMLGPEIGTDYAKMKFFVTIGKNLGDKWDRQKSVYVNRMCVGINGKRKGLVMAEMDLETGTEFQLMRRGFEKDLIEDKVRSFIEGIEKEGKEPLFALYLNCAGRAMAYSQNETEDVMYVQNAIEDKFPLLGIYEAGELAMIEKELHVFDWTGVFCLFSRPKAGLEG